MCSDNTCQRPTPVTGGEGEVDMETLRTEEDMDQEEEGEIVEDHQTSEVSSVVTM